MEIILLWLLEKSCEQLLEVLFTKLVDWLLEKHTQQNQPSHQSSVKNSSRGEIEADK
ncbi:hypothetical protein [Limnofasciculus baicalensis]|uniref:Uncharacterized protein n=1 Tax=Limnofasciculus baicalensis BBK-W-15 TaxID=2699891 RepID=A0AAE3GPA3_9CYAN|nr:hypothetical protein [Limnofasciculus baicalensis]MCP2727506.1 hypothetical protein [Limnofasciculus baicalensis BBK-W-15]